MSRNIQTVDRRVPDIWLVPFTNTEEFVQDIPTISIPDTYVVHSLRFYPVWRVAGKSV